MVSNVPALPHFLRNGTSSLILFDLVIEVAHVLPRMTHPELVQALRTLRVVPQVGVPKTTERMVPSFVRSGERIHVVHSPNVAG